MVWFGFETASHVAQVGLDNVAEDSLEFVPPASICQILGLQDAAAPCRVFCGAEDGIQAFMYTGKHFPELHSSYLP